MVEIILNLKITLTMDVVISTASRIALFCFSMTPAVFLINDSNSHGTEMTLWVGPQIRNDSNACMFCFLKEIKIYSQKLIKHA